MHLQAARELMRLDDGDRNDLPMAAQQGTPGVSVARRAEKNRTLVQCRKRRPHHCAKLVAT